MSYQNNLADQRLASAAQLVATLGGPVFITGAYDSLSSDALIVSVVYTGSTIASTLGYGACTALQRVLLPLLTSASQPLSISGNQAMTLVDLSALPTLATSLSLTDNGALTTLRLDSLTAITAGASLDCSYCAALDFAAPALVEISGSLAISFASCDLVTPEVDALLALLAATSGTGSGTIDVSGTNAKPSVPIVSLTINNSGGGYMVGDPISISGSPDGSGFAAHVSNTDIDTNGITEVTIDSPGTGYTGAPTLEVSSMIGGFGAEITANMDTNPSIATLQGRGFTVVTS